MAYAGRPPCATCHGCRGCVGGGRIEGATLRFSPTWGKPPVYHQRIICDINQRGSSHKAVLKRFIDCTHKILRQNLLRILSHRIAKIYVSCQAATSFTVFVKKYLRIVYKEDLASRWICTRPECKICRNITSPGVEVRNYTVKNCEESEVTPLLSITELLCSFCNVQTLLTVVINTQKTNTQTQPRGQSELATCGSIASLRITVLLCIGAVVVYKSIAAVSYVLLYIGAVVVYKSIAALSYVLHLSVLLCIGAVVVYKTIAAVSYVLLYIGAVVVYKSIAAVSYILHLSVLLCIVAVVLNVLGDRGMHRFGFGAHIGGWYSAYSLYGDEEEDYIDYDFYYSWQYDPKITVSDRAMISAYNSKITTLILQLGTLKLQP